MTIIINKKHRLSVTKFPDKTSQVWKLPFDDVLWPQYADIEWWFEEEAEIVHLAQLKDLLDSHEVESYLHIHYLPYGRQDKDVDNYATFALHTFAAMLNFMKFRRVVIDDPHSDRALRLISNSTAFYPFKEVGEVYVKEKIDLICYPDAGATCKYQSLYPYPFIYGEKNRDQLTGKIIGYKLIGEARDKNVLIVDDLCDGGMTFRILAKELLASGAKKVILFVSHGIFSNGLDVLFESGINKVFTTNDVFPSRGVHQLTAQEMKIKGGLKEMFSYAPEFHASL